MKLTFTRTHLFSPAKYEKLELSATVEVDTEADDIDQADVENFVREVMDNTLSPDIDRLDRASQTPEDETYIHAWKDAIDGTHSSNEG